jgi:hypothetical protein
VTRHKAEAAGGDVDDAAVKAVKNADGGVNAAIPDSKFDHTCVLHCKSIRFFPRFLFLFLLLLYWGVNAAIPDSKYNNFDHTRFRVNQKLAFATTHSLYIHSFVCYSPY